MVLQENNGRYERTGPERVLVVRNSATGGHDKSDPASTIQIDANHSDMVKLMPGHHIISLVAYKLRAITCFTRDNTLDHVELKQIEDEDEPARTASVAEFVSGAIERFPDLDYWNTQGKFSLPPLTRCAVDWYLITRPQLLFNHFTLPSGTTGLHRLMKGQGVHLNGCSIDLRLAWCRGCTMDAASFGSVAALDLASPP